MINKEKTVLGVDLPNASPHQGLATLNRIADAYDACLAALPGLYWLHSHPAACLAGDRERGQLLLISQGEITSRLRERGVPARFGGEGGL